MGGTLRAVVAAVALVGGVRVGIAPAERCPTVTIAEVEDTVTDAVAWLGRNQRDDGTWAYQVDDEGTDLGGYNVTRHAGVLLSLQQATSARIAGAAASADLGLRWALDHLVPAGDGQALTLDGDPPTGASALLVRALIERDDSRLDDELLDLGRFLVGQVLPSGAVSARWSIADGAPRPEVRDRFFTGETFWALVGLADRFPDERSFADGVRRVGVHVPVRDEEEDRFPPTSDHWASYAYADLGDRMSATQRAHAERLAGIVGVQVRGESTRWKGGLQGVIRRGPAVGSGLATLGEGGAALLRALGESGAPGLTARVRCTAGMLVERQEPDGGPAVEGAWFAGGVTRMDDQQHAISALLYARPAFVSGSDAVGGGSERHSLLWLLVASIVVANPLRELRRREGRRWWPVGALAGPADVVVAAGAVALLLGLSGPVLDGLSVSPASARAAAGTAVAVAAIASLVRPGQVTGTLAGALAVLAVSVGADDGARALPFAVLAAALTIVVPARWRGPSGSRVVAMLSLLVAADLLVDGVLGV